MRKMMFDIMNFIFDMIRIFVEQRGQVIKDIRGFALPVQEPSRRIVPTLGFEIA